MFIIRDGEKVRGIRLKNFKDADGNDAPIDGTPTWSVSDENLGTLKAVEGVDDGEQEFTTTVGPGLGDCVINATVDVAIGEDVRPVTFSEVIRVIANDAVAGTIEITGTPEPRDTPPA